MINRFSIDRPDFLNLDFDPPVDINKKSLHEELRKASTSIIADYDADITADNNNEFFHNELDEVLELNEAKAAVLTEIRKLLKDIKNTEFTNLQSKLLRIDIEVVNKNSYTIPVFVCARCGRGQFRKAVNTSGSSLIYVSLARLRNWLSSIKSTIPTDEIKTKVEETRNGEITQSAILASYPKQYYKEWYKSAANCCNDLKNNKINSDIDIINNCSRESGLDSHTAEEILSCLDHTLPLWCLCNKCAEPMTGSKMVRALNRLNKVVDNGTVNKAANRSKIFEFNCSEPGCTNRIHIYSYEMWKKASWYEKGAINFSDKQLKKWLSDYKDLWCKCTEHLPITQDFDSKNVTQTISKDNCSELYDCLVYSLKQLNKNDTIVIEQRAWGDRKNRTSTVSIKSFQKLLEAKRVTGSQLTKLTWFWPKRWANKLNIPDEDQSFVCPIKMMWYRYTRAVAANKTKNYSYWYKKQYTNIYELTIAEEISEKLKSILSSDTYEIKGSGTKNGQYKITIPLKDKNQNLYLDCAIFMPKDREKPFAAVEFDGYFTHYDSVATEDNNETPTRRRDHLKDAWCSENLVHLYRIRYDGNYSNKNVIVKKFIGDFASPEALLAELSNIAAEIAEDIASKYQKQKKAQTNSVIEPESAVQETYFEDINLI